MTIKFDNKDRAKKVSNVLRIIVMLAIVPIGINYLWIETTDKMVEMFMWLFLIVIIALYYTGGFCYVEVDASPAKLDVKYYNLFPFWREYKRIVIPVERIKYVKVRKGLGRFGAGLLICGRIKGRLAMFPSVGLSACSQKQIEELKVYAASFSNK
ncbi:hypothetical protein KEM09_03680 [Carboxylicivirga mesophila]|uniref:DUF304 domain-containing protein n=1 Tax=Carboxylicivirga mesophila TaxID=1166478 RepID=A0ABS5K683_9BACT|nr:hypothetical protein [Carboxylicivirga mesophila]MBS2210484.1 hypothetical protein [Carboxylicivirga mesophila]